MRNRYSADIYPRDTGTWSSPQMSVYGFGVDGGRGGGGDGEASCGKPISCVVFSQSKSCVLGRAREAYLVYEQRALTLYVRGGRGAEGGAP